MAWLYRQPIPEGTPWLDYKQATKTAYDLVFLFRIENFLDFILREICVSFPCDVNGRSQLPLKAKAEISSTQLQFFPKPLPPELFSSPSQNFRQGALNEEAQGMRLQPITWNYPCERGDTITVTISGSPVSIVIGCMITGRKYEG